MVPDQKYGGGISIWGQVRLTGSLKLMVILLVKHMPVAAFTGLLPITVGAVVSDVVPVWKVQLYSASIDKPFVSRAALEMVASQSVFAGKSTV